MHAAHKHLYRDVLKVYDQDCYFYDSSLEKTKYDVGSGDFPSSIFREASMNFSWQVYFCTIAIWSFCMVLNWKGVTSMRFIYYFSVPLSVVFLVSMLLFGILLGNGNSEGVRQYLFGDAESTDFKWGALANWNLWSDAARQNLYSIGVT